jgi:hypothetical protein
VETGCRGGQGSPRAVTPNGWKEVIVSPIFPVELLYSEVNRFGHCVIEFDYIFV